MARPYPESAGPAQAGERWRAEQKVAKTALSRQKALSAWQAIRKHHRTPDEEEQQAWSVLKVAEMHFDQAVDALAALAGEGQIERWRAETPQPYTPIVRAERRALEQAYLVVRCQEGEANQATLRIHIEILAQRLRECDQILAADVDALAALEGQGMSDG